MRAMPSPFTSAAAIRRFTVCAIPAGVRVRPSRVRIDWAWDWAWAGAAARLRPIRKAGSRAFIAASPRVVGAEESKLPCGGQRQTREELREVTHPITVRAEPVEALSFPFAAEEKDKASTGSARTGVGLFSCLRAEPQRH